jgi:hypothetical protein
MRRPVVALALALGVAGIAAGVVLAHGPGPAGAPDPGHGATGFQRLGGAGASPVGVLAELTGLSNEEIHAARLDGQSLAEIAEENGVSQATLVEALVEQRMARIDELLEAGRISEDQAATLRDRVPEQVEAMVTATGSDPGMRGLGGGAPRGGAMGRAAGHGAFGARSWAGEGPCIDTQSAASGGPLGPRFSV